MKKSKKHRPHFGWVLYSTLAVIFIWRRLLKEDGFFTSFSTF